jgi:hypothetical protein
VRLRSLAPFALLSFVACQGEVRSQAPDEALSGGSAGQLGAGAGGSPSPGGAGSAQGGAAAGQSSGGSSGVATAGTGPAACESIASSGAPVPMRRLTATQVERTVEDVFGVTLKLAVSDERLLTYRSNISTSVDTASARGYFDFASAVIAAVDWSRCETSCLSWLLDDVGARLFRRPLSSDERTRYTSLFELGVESSNEQEAAGWVLEALLQSPTFLYLDEVEEEDGSLDDHSVAARLALLLWGRNPDAALLEKAENVELSTPEQVESAALELLSDARSEAGIAEFVDQWFDLARLDDPDVRPDLAELGADTVAALRTEPVRYFASLLREGGSLTELMTSAATVPLPALTQLYGSDIVNATSARVDLDPDRRGGLLALPGVAAALAHAERTSPTLRGKAVLTGLLCTPPQPPPADVDTTLPEIEEGLGTRARLELHMSAPACMGCHVGMDGIGFALEKLDWLGRFREEENGVAVDDGSTFPLGTSEVTVQGAPELGRVLAESPDVPACVSRQWLRYALGVTESAAVDCLVQELATDLRGERGLERMLVKALRSDWFRRGPGDTQ